MGAQLTGNWKGAGERLAAVGGFIKRELHGAMDEAGQILVTCVRAEMQQTLAPALHPFTVERKGNDKPLSGGAMEEAIEYRVSPNRITVWVGVPEGPLVVAARANEYGATIDVTEKMRGYLHANGLHLSGETMTVVIPERPFIRPGIFNAKGEIARAVRRALKEAEKKAKKGR